MDLFATRKNVPVLIAGHRGTWAGNIAPNTIAAYEAAIGLGADIIESDLCMSSDGFFFAYHSGEELGRFGYSFKMQELTEKEVRSLEFRNSMFDLSGQKLDSYDDILESLKNRCFINVDRAWKCSWDKALRYLKSKNMDDQLIIKCPPERELLQTMEEEAPHLMYMGILRNPAEYDFVRSFRINTIAMEINYEDASLPIASANFVHRVHGDGLLVWSNALTLNGTKKLSGGYDDDISIKRGPQYGWGKLIEKGYDIIQTDWPALIRDFIKSK